MEHNDFLLDQHIAQMDVDSARDNAIELLAEQLSSAASNAVNNTCMASPYDFSHKAKNNLTNGSDDFNELFYDIAEKLIDSLG